MHDADLALPKQWSSLLGWPLAYACPGTFVPVPHAAALGHCTALVSGVLHLELPWLAFSWLLVVLQSVAGDDASACTRGSAAAAADNRLDTGIGVGTELSANMTGADLHIEVTAEASQILVLAGLSYYKSNQQDPNISQHGAEDDSEAEDFQVHASDYVILAARNEDEVSHIEVRWFRCRLACKP